MVITKVWPRAFRYVGRRKPPKSAKKKSASLCNINPPKSVSLNTARVVLEFNWKVRGRKVRGHTVLFKYNRSPFPNGIFFYIWNQNIRTVRFACSSGTGGRAGELSFELWMASTMNFNQLAWQAYDEFVHLDHANLSIWNCTD